MAEDKQLLAVNREDTVDVTSASPLPTAPRGVVLLSGGLDSTTVLAGAVRSGFEVHALSFNYGQRHAVELESARRVADHFGVQHKTVEIDLRAFGGSSLTSDMPVPKNRDLTASEVAGRIPSTYVPARNTIFLSFALAYAEVIGSTDIFIGVNALDYSGYPDCRPAYVEAFEKLANLATRSGVEDAAPFRVHSPLVHLTKKEIVELGLSLGVDYSMTRSCYDPTDGNDACGLCDSCQLRLRGFADNSVTDPITYSNRPLGSEAT